MLDQPVTAVRELVDQPLKGLNELYENSLKAMLVCGLEFYLSASLVASFFQCPDESMQDEQELQTLYTLAWVPLVLSVMLVYGPKLSRTIFPSPENFERNMLHGKIVVWIYALCFLVWDQDMVVKTGPSLGVSALFCVADVGRFVMDMKRLTEVEVDDYGNSFIGDRPPHLDSEDEDDVEQNYRPQKSPIEPEQRNYQHQNQEENYTVHVISSNASEQPPKKPWQAYKQPSAQVPVQDQPQQFPQKQEQQADPKQGLPAPLFGATNKPGSRRRMGLSRKGKREQNQSQSAINSEFIAVLDPNSAVEKEPTEMVAKKSFTYEF